MRDHDHLAEFLALPAIQRDFLAVLASGGPQYGLELKDTLELHQQTNISSGRLYSNLDKLDEKGLIEKGKFTDRRNRYELTDRGKRALVRYQQWLAEAQNNELSTASSIPTLHPLERLTQLDAPDDW